MALMLKVDIYFWHKCSKSQKVALDSHRATATEEEQRILDQLHVMSQMLQGVQDSAREDALARQARRQALAELRL